MTKDNFEQCEFMSVHSDIVDNIAKVMPDEVTLSELADLYKVFGDSTRIKILYVLFASSMCVCDIATLLGMSVSAISHQLKILKQANLISFRREGKSVFYSLADDHVRTMIDQGMEHIQE